LLTLKSLESTQSIQIRDNSNRIAGNFILNLKIDQKDFQVTFVFIKTETCLSSGIGIHFRTGDMSYINMLIVLRSFLKYYPSTNFINLILMLKVEPNVPLKETLNYLSKFPKFSLIEKIEPKFFQTSVEGSKKVA